VAVVVSVVNETSFPYAVPTLLVAYARIWYVVPADNPVKLLVKAPEIVPSVVFEFAVVGLAVRLQQIPLTVITAPPLEVIVPPEAAAVCVIPEAAVVVRAAADVRVVNEISFPYDVPILLVAYARTWYVVPADKPVKLPEKVPEVVPSVVFESAVVGLAV
jgi:hypothetical protein